MRNRILQAGAWAAATGAAVLLSWFGVHAVLGEEGGGAPQRVTVPSQDGTGLPDVSSTRLPTPGGGAPSGTVGTAVTRPPSSAAASRSGRATAKPSDTPDTPSVKAAPQVKGSVAARTGAPAQGGPGRTAGPGGREAGAARGGSDGGASDGGEVRGYSVVGGQVALALHRDRAELVSATPVPDWEMQVWHGDRWLRVDFRRGEQVNSVFAVWNGHPPRVETVNR